MSDAKAPPERPLRADAERNRERILSAARELFSLHGLGVTMDEIAARAGVGVGTIYRRFSDRSRVIDALFRERMLEITAIADEALAHEDGWEGLVWFLTRSQDLQARDRGIHQMLVSAGGDEDRGRQMQEAMAPRAVALVERAHATGQLRADFSAYDMPLLQVMLGAIVDFTRDVQPDAWRRILAVVIDGLRTPEGCATPLDADPLTPEGISAAMMAWGGRLGSAPRC